MNKEDKEKTWNLNRSCKTRMQVVQLAGEQGQITGRGETKRSHILSQTLGCLENNIDKHVTNLTKHVKKKQETKRIKTKYTDENTVISITLLSPVIAIPTYS